MTVLESGSVWNTMPCHTHERRMEVYFYFAMAPDAVVFHLLGARTKRATSSVRNEQAVINPSWSLHSGVGTQAYTFIWGMVGENQVFRRHGPPQADGSVLTELARQAGGGATRYRHADTPWGKGPEAGDRPAVPSSGFRTRESAPRIRCRLHLQES